MTDWISPACEDEMHNECFSDLCTCECHAKPKRSWARSALADKQRNLATRGLDRRRPA